MMDFPIPSYPPPSMAKALLHPTWTSTTPEATETMLKLLRDNHSKYHVMFESGGSSGLHNHVAHYMVTLWALGAQKHTLEAAYDLGGYREVLDIPHEVEMTNETFNDHLGDPSHYKAYLDFFKEQLMSKTVPQVLEEWIFGLEASYEQDEIYLYDARGSSPSASDSSSSSGDQKETVTQRKIARKGMYSRLYDGLMHPFIHLGCGLELGLPGLVAEGLASVAIHQANTFSCLFPPSWWESSLNPSSASVSLESKEMHAFDILARMSVDSRLKFRKRFAASPRATWRHQEVLREYAAEWKFDATDPQVVSRKVEELAWMNVVLYGVGGRVSEDDFRADFYLMHLVTSSIFLSSIVAQLRPDHQALCLRGYLITTLVYWLTRGRPIPDIRSFMSSPLPSSPTDLPQPSPSIQLPNGVDHSVPGAGRTESEAKLWEDILESTITFPDDHLPKLQRALSHFAKVYGRREAGEEDFKRTKLDGAELLDGSLFIRAAALTVKRLLERGTEGYSATGAIWDHKGF